jgi:hypothetical protein
MVIQLRFWATPLLDAWETGYAAADDEIGTGVVAVVARDPEPVLAPTSTHAHVSTESADCDGRYSRSYVLTSETGDDAHTFRLRVLGMLIDLDEPRTVTVTPEGFTWSGPTDEGYVSGEVEWCTDDDATERGTYRDHTAESMGY